MSDISLPGDTANLRFCRYLLSQETGFTARQPMPGEKAIFACDGRFQFRINGQKTIKPIRLDKYSQLTVPNVTFADRNDVTVELVLQ